MKADAQVLELLNETLKNELTSINQYWLHYRMLDNWGVHRLAEFERSESIDEMKHADRLAERMEVLRADLELELESIAQLKGAIPHCESVRDFVSRDLFSDILDSEEEQANTLETQFELIERMGLQNYIQLQSKPAED